MRGLGSQLSLLFMLAFSIWLPIETYAGLPSSYGAVAHTVCTALITGAAVTIFGIAVWKAQWQMVAFCTAWPFFGLVFWRMMRNGQPLADLEKQLAVLGADWGAVIALFGVVSAYLFWREQA